MSALGSVAGRVARRYGSKNAVIAGSGVTALSFLFLAVVHAHPYDMLISAALMGVGIGLAFAALGNLVVQAVPPEQTGAATGMNTVMRTLGGALGGQIVATLIADNVAGGLPSVTGFTESFLLEAGFLVVAMCAGTLVPGRPRLRPLALDQRDVASAREAG
jgi:MFS family permease